MMNNKKVFVVKTDTYKKSLYKLKDPSIILSIEKKVDKLVDNPNIAEPMAKQHLGVCEIKVGTKYRVYCIKKERTIILFLLGPAIHHKKNYKKNKEYQKLFSRLEKLNKEFKEDFIKEFEDSLS